MKKVLLALFLAPALCSAASAQEAQALWADLAETRPFRADQEVGGQVAEDWYSSKWRGSISAFYRASFPSSTQVTVDGLWYSDFFSYANGFSVEADLLNFLTPNWGVGPYVSAGWDRFYGDSLHFFNGDFFNVGDMDMETVILGVKIVQRVSPVVFWDGHLGGGVAHYQQVLWSGVDNGVPFANEQLFKPIYRGVFELGGRLCVGSEHIQADFGFGLRYIGGAARGKDVTNFIDTDILITFMLELGLTVRF
jgi:hypothetical protein